MAFLFHIPSEAAGKCLGAAIVYEKGLHLESQSYERITVHGYKGSLTHAEPNTARAIKGKRKYIWHRLTKIGNHYVDWTARQFDSHTPYPLVMELKELQKFWKHIEDTTNQETHNEEKKIKG